MVPENASKITDRRIGIRIASLRYFDDLVIFGFDTLATPGNANRSASENLADLSCRDNRDLRMILLT